MPPLPITLNRPERNCRLWKNFIKVVGLADIFESGDVDEKNSNFEEICSRMHSRDPDSYAVAEIERRVTNYFRSLTLPPTPTIYNYLAMSLRPKDLVATFNWDPFFIKHSLGTGMWHRCHVPLFFTATFRLVTLRRIKDQDLQDGSLKRRDKNMCQRGSSTQLRKRTTTAMSSSHASGKGLRDA